MEAVVDNKQTVFAIISGQPLTKLPADLFIPPNALKILLDSFSGPLDLLLYLIRRQNIDILNIPITQITQQYLNYIALIEEYQLELAAEYLVMAAMLAEIKSRLLLPTITNETEENEDDPRLDLVKKLQIYEQFKQAAANLDTLERVERDNARFAMPVDGLTISANYPEVQLADLVNAMISLLNRPGLPVAHQIIKETFSVKERMILVLECLQLQQSIGFNELLKRKEGRAGLAVTLMAILELARQSLLIINQTGAYTPLYLQAI